MPRKERVCLGLALERHSATGPQGSATSPGECEPRLQYSQSLVLLATPIPGSPRHGSTLPLRQPGTSARQQWATGRRVPVRRPRVPGEHAGVMRDLAPAEPERRRRLRRLSHDGHGAGAGRECGDGAEEGAEVLAIPTRSLEQSGGVCEHRRGSEPVLGGLEPTEGDRSRL